MKRVEGYGSFLRQLGKAQSMNQRIRSGGHEIHQHRLTRLRSEVIRGMNRYIILQERRYGIYG